MNTQQLKTEMDEWVKHFNHEITTMNKCLATIAQSSKEIRRIDLNQRNDLSDILYIKEVIHRLEQENDMMRKQIAFIHLTHKLALSVKKLEQTMEANHNE